MGVILFVCPNETLAEQVRLTTTKIGVEPNIVVGDLKKGLEAVQNYEKEIDVLISRGGTAQLLEKYCIPKVVCMKASLSEIFTNICELKAEGAKRIAVVGNSNWMDDLPFVVHDGEIQFYFRPTYESHGQIGAIRALKKEGVDAIIAMGRGAIRFAEKLGLKTKEIITSSELSIKMALEQANVISTAIQQERLKNVRIQVLIDNLDDGFIMLSGNEVSFSNKKAQELFNTEKISFQAVAPYLGTQDKIVHINEHQIFLKPLSYKVANDRFEKILYFQEVNNIHRSEQIIRRSLYERGFFAKNTFQNIIGESETIKERIAVAKEYARFDSNILLRGETGTGKEIFAQSIHNESLRRRKPFLSVNCASIPVNLLESELFGYAEGAFTGAKRGGKYGLFELAHEGTLFLDEISELSLELQARLLRVLQEKEIMRIGDDRIIPVDVRIICATNKNLLECIKEGTFRADLYYRINVLRLFIPPLRERREDICLLFHFFLASFGEKYKKQMILDKSGENFLMDYPWPGNVRELMNLAERAVAITRAQALDGSLLGNLLQDEIPKENAIEQPEDFGDGCDMKTMESRLIEHMLKSRTPEEVCAQLGISRVTLWRKLNKKQTKKSP